MMKPCGCWEGPWWSVLPPPRCGAHESWDRLQETGKFDLAAYEYGMKVGRRMAEDEQRASLREAIRKGFLPDG